LSELSEPDYDALVMRFSKNQDLLAVGRALGVSDDAAQKRVSRALDKLRDLLSQRGITTTATALSVLLCANAVQTAPVGLAAAISSAAALSGTTIAATATASKAIAMTTLQKTLITLTIVVAGVATPTVIQHRAQVKLRAENQSLRQQVEQLTQLTAENERLSNGVAESKHDAPPQSGPPRELLRLRGEVGSLRRQNQELAKLLGDQSQPTASFEPSSSWADAGNATPETAAGTFAWAIKVKNMDKLADLVMFGGNQADTNVAMFDLSKYLQPWMSEIESSRLLFKDNPTPDEVILWYQSKFNDGHTLVSPLTLTRSGDQWKVKIVLGPEGGSN